MAWFWSSSEKTAPAPAETQAQQPVQPVQPVQPAQPAQPAQSEKPKPCCVCKTEKTTRDDCMLFSKSDDPAKECQTTIEQYKKCMDGFGFKV